MFCNTPTTSKNTSKQSAHTPDRPANGVAAILAHPSPHTAASKVSSSFSIRTPRSPEKKKRKDTTADKFKNTTVKFKKLGELS